MGFESYTVVLSARPDAPRVVYQNADEVSHLAKELMHRWLEIRLDDMELSELPYPAQSGEAFLIYEGLDGVFQIMLSQSQERIKASVRFTYCNPRRVYSPLLHSDFRAKPGFSFCRGCSESFNTKHGSEPPPLVSGCWDRGRSLSAPG